MKQRIVIDIDKELWRQVSMKAAELQMTKKEFVEAAMRRKLERRAGEDENGR